MRFIDVPLELAINGSLEFPIDRTLQLSVN